MQINLVSCIFVLDSEKNVNIRKNDIKKIKVIIDDNNMLPIISFNTKEIKDDVRNKISNIIESNIFHLEQVLSVGKDNGIDIIYLAITNIENINNQLDKYKLVDFKVENNNTIIFNNNSYQYKTIEKANYNNIEYYHDIKVNDEVIKRTLMYLITSYKRIRANIDTTDIIFKFMPKTFTLEDIRIVYELIKDSKVDKSNFRKKIVKYCEKIDSINSNKTGYRPSQNYKFKPLKGDVWI